MFYPEKMNRVTIVSPKAYMKEVIDILYSLGVIHIKDYLPGDMPTGTPLKDAENVSELILELHSIKSQIPVEKSVSKKKMTSKEMERYVRSIKSRVTSLSLEINNLNEKNKSLEKEKEDLEFLSSSGIESLDVLKEYKNFDLLFGYVENLEQVKRTSTVLSSSKKIGKLYPIAVLVRKDKKQDIISTKKFNEIKLNVKGTGSVDKRLKEVADIIKSLKNKIVDLKKDLNKISKESSGKINYIESVLMERIKKSEAPLKFASSSHAFLVNGWIPVKGRKILLQKLSGISENIFVKLEDVHDDEEVPTKMSNPTPVRPFQFFLNLYSIPRYNEIDPSFLVFLTFPLFYGFILGDIGYGAVLLVLSSVARMKKRHALIDIMIISSIATMLFGFVFGEAFGSGHVLGFELHSYLHRIEDINQLMIISAVIGLVHLNSGFILGFVNEFHHHGFRKAFAAKISWIGIQIAAILFLLNSLGYTSVNFYITLAIGMLSFLAVIKAEGMFGIIELPSLISNVLSYLRLAAVGLASAALALVVNQFAGNFFQQGGIMIAAGVLTLILGHGVNLALGILGAFLHSMRLHYVEMFTKFYEGSGKSYKPFGK